MKYIVFILFLASVFLHSCDGYQESTVSANYILFLNSELTNSQQNGAAWSSSAEAIARHFFPPESHDGGPTRYEINKKVKSANECIVAVLEEGPIDDEVLGMRHVVYFKADKQGWKITDLKVETKRRL